MKIAHLFRKPDAQETLDTLLEKAQQELETTRTQLVLARDHLHTVEASAAFHEARLQHLKSMQPQAAYLPQPVELEGDFVQK